MAELCRQIGITDTTFYKWRSKFAGLEVSDARGLRSLRRKTCALKAWWPTRRWISWCSKRCWAQNDLARPSPPGRTPDHRGARQLRAAGLPVDRPQPQDVAVRSARPRRGSAQTFAGAGRGAQTVRVPQTLPAAAPRGLGDEPQACLSACAGKWRWHCACGQNASARATRG